MPHIKKEKTVPYSTIQMYELVNDIDAYADFVDFCIASQATSRQHNVVEGKLTFRLGKLEKTFSTLNHCEPYEKIILSLLDGPFKSLSGFWHFTPTPSGGCRIMLDLSFEFSTPMLALLLNPIFEKIAGSLVSSFVQRAEDRYAHH
jgi:ribosome-associated toxin RatA of RatAB toxin-antitoxin module